MGNALARSLAAAGYPIAAVTSRTLQSARSLADVIPGCRPVATAQAVADLSDLVFVTTRDDAIAEVAGSARWRPGVSLVHTNGAKSLYVLQAAAAQGASTASLHPLQTFATIEEASEQIRGCVFGMEAEGELRQLLLQIVSDLEGTAIELRPEDKALYHAAAVLISNYTVTLTKLATVLWLRFGRERSQALRALLPLLQGTLRNLESNGLPTALTGPVSRGDVASVERHLAALEEAAPETLAAYRELALLTIPVALAKGGLTDEDAGALRRLLSQDQETRTSLTSEGARSN